MFFDGEKIRSVTGGRWCQRPEYPVEIVGVGTDTRANLDGRAFLALKGAHHDGHDHLARAAAAGARMAIVEIAQAERAKAVPNLAVLAVPDSRRALRQVARAYRRTLGATRVVAVTGSAGKTTTKEMIHAVLSQRLGGTAAPKSFNNEIGVPITLLAARPGDHYVVVEIGTNAPGEVRMLAEIAEPDIAVITSIGSAHLEAFETRGGVAREKSAILGHLRAHGLAVVTADAPALAPYLRPLANTVTFGAKDGADLQLTDRGRHAGRGGGWWFEVNRRTRFDLALPGRHNALNALAAVAIGRRFGLGDDEISCGLGGMPTPPMRMTRSRVAGVNVFNDAYNANPESMAAALDVFEELTPRGRRVLVLGDMQELGERSETLHEELGRQVLGHHRRMPLVVLVGEHVAATTRVLRAAWPEKDRILHVARLDARSMRKIAGRLRRSDQVLLKASRGIGLERLIDVIEKHPPAQPEPKRGRGKREEQQVMRGEKKVESSE